MKKLNPERGRENTLVMEWINTNVMKHGLEEKKGAENGVSTRLLNIGGAIE